MAGPIDFKKFNPFSGIAVKDVVGVEIGANTIKFVHARFYANKIQVVNILSQNIAGLPDVEVLKAIKASFAKINAKNPEVINILPSHLAITKNIEMPSVDPHEIREIINLQAGRHTPYSREEIIVDYIDIGTFKHSYTKILLIIVARSAVKRQFDLVEKAGFKVNRVLLDSEGLAWSVPRMLKLDVNNSVTGIVHIDESFTEFIAVFKEKLIFVRSIPIGAEHLSVVGESARIRFSEEIKRSLEAYNSENIERPPSQFILCGAIHELKDLESFLYNILHLPVKVLNYTNSLLITQGILKTVQEAKLVSFLNIIAPLLALNSLKIDLTPEEARLKKSIEERGKDLIKTGVFVLVNFIFIFSILISKIYFRNLYLTKLNKKYGSLENETSNIEKDFEKISLIKNYILKRGYPLEVLTELHNITPLDLELDDIRYDDQGKFTIRGTAETMSSVFGFVETMGKSKYFKDVKTRYTTKRKEGDKDVTDFEISCTLNREGV